MRVWLLIASLLPIWRRAGVDRPLNSWQYISEALSRPMKHIPIEEALKRAEEAGYLKRPSGVTIDW